MERPIIYIVDDEPEIVELISVFLREINAEIRKFQNPEDFLQSFDGTRHGCVLMDIQMPGLTGIQVLDRISGWLSVYPVILVSGHANVPITVSAMKVGAYDVLQKPFTQTEITHQVKKALHWGVEMREKNGEVTQTWAAMQKLTPREKEVMNLLLEGHSSRDISTILNISRFTADHHRSHILEKLNCLSLSGMTSAVARAKAFFEANHKAPQV